MTMHSYEDRKRAVELYIESGFSPAAVKNTLGFPSRSTLYEWYRDYIARGYIKKHKKRWSKYSEEEKMYAVEYYLKSDKSVYATVADLGYPALTLMYQWIDELAPGVRKTHSKKHVVHTDKDRESAIRKAYSKDQGCICDAIASAKVDKVTFYKWRKKILGKDAQKVVDDINEELPDDPIELKRLIEKLKAEAHRYKLEVAIRKGIAELIKKRCGHRPEPVDEQGENNTC